MPSLGACEGYHPTHGFSVLRKRCFFFQKTIPTVAGHVLVQAHFDAPREKTSNVDQVSNPEHQLWHH